jgi:hypothetical protein
MTKSVVSSNPAQVRCIRYNIMWYSFSVSDGIGQWFSPCSPVSSTNKTDHIDITEILLKVALNTINPNPISILAVLYSLCGGCYEKKAY